MNKNQPSETRIPASNGDEINQAAGEFSSSDELDPSKLANIWIDPSEVHKAGAVKKLLTTVPLRKPNKHEFFRAHPGEEYWRIVALIDTGGGGLYAVQKNILPHLDPRDFFYVYLVLCVSKFGKPFLWPLKLADPERRNSWNESALTIAKLAKTNWLKIRSYQEDGRGSGFYEAEEPIADFGDPQWPSETRNEICTIAFKGGRIIDSLDHPVIKQLTGEIK